MKICIRNDSSHCQTEELESSTYVAGVEVPNAGAGVVAEWLYVIFNKMWAKGEVPADWKKAVTVPLHKKAAKECATTTEE